MTLKIDKHIEIVRSNKALLSSMSPESCDAILTVLKRHYARVGVTLVNNLTDLESLVLKQPDLVFLGMKFIPDGSKLIWLSTFLEQHGIAYTGSAQAAQFSEYDKAAAKKCIIDAGLATAPFCVIRQVNQSAIYKIDLDFPLFVKPLNRGGGVGIDCASVVHNQIQLSSKVQTIADNLGADSLVEQYLPGREFSVAILKNDVMQDFAVMSLELIAPMINGVRLLSKAVKSANAEEAVKISDLDIKRRVEELALDVFYALGARDYGRIDIRLDKYGTAQFLEANLLPSLISGYGSFPKACVINIGLDHEQMILRIVELAQNRDLNLESAAKSTVAIPILAALEAVPSVI